MEYLGFPLSWIAVSAVPVLAFGLSLVLVRVIHVRWHTSGPAAFLVPFALFVVALALTALLGEAVELPFRWNTEVLLYMAWVAHIALTSGACCASPRRSPGCDGGSERARPGSRWRYSGWWCR